MNSKTITKTGIVIFLYNRLFDPLVQSNFWLYIDDYLKDPTNPYRFHVISYEDTNYPINREQINLVNKWKSQGLEWTPLRWHQGTGAASKLLDLLSAFRSMLTLRLNDYHFVVGYGSVSGAMAYLCARVLKMKLFIHTFEPHSEYSKDSHLWSKNSWNYFTLNYLEKKTAFFATIIASGTRFMQDKLNNEWKVKGSFYKIPSIANEIKFLFNSMDRLEIRKKLGLNDNHTVLLYSGKFGGLYLNEKIAWICRWLLDQDQSYHFLIVTPNTYEEVYPLFINAGLKEDSYTITHSSYEYIHKYYSAADFGLVAMAPGSSKKFSSSIKIGEYLCTGLPYLISQGIGEDYLIAEDEKVGIVIGDYDKNDILTAWPKLQHFMEMPAEVRRSHCRKVGLRYRSFDSLNPIFKQALSRLVSQ